MSLEADSFIIQSLPGMLEHHDPERGDQDHLKTQNLDSILDESFAEQALPAHGYHKCHDCDVLEGELHHFGCLAERCGQCGGQYILCECTDALPENVLVTKKDPRPRVPRIVWPNLCARCDCLWPEMFHVPTNVWEHYIEIAARDKIVCLGCWEEIADLIDGRGYELAHGRARLFSSSR